MKSWYKIAQIWESKLPREEFDDSGEKSFPAYLRQLYEMEYKYNMLKSRPFNGMEKRKQNILEQIRLKFAEAQNEVAKQLLETFGKWLSQHAITDPKQWAVARVDMFQDVMEETGETSLIDAVVSEYILSLKKLNRRTPDLNVNNYSVYDSEKVNRIAFSKLIRLAVDNIEEFPSFKEAMDLMMEDYKERLRQDYVGRGAEGVKDFNVDYSKRFRSESSVERYIDSLSSDTMDFWDLFQDEENFKSTIDNNGLADQVCTELFEKIVFPLWYEYWGSQGIDDTRENVESSYKDLQNIGAMNLAQASSVINIALNRVHQGGAMLDYVIQDVEKQGVSADIRDVFSELTSGSFVNKANEELQEIGVDMGDITSKMKPTKPKRKLSKEPHWDITAPYYAEEKTDNKGKIPEKEELVEAMQYNWYKQASGELVKSFYKVVIVRPDGHEEVLDSLKDILILAVSRKQAYQIFKLI